MRKDSDTLTLELREALINLKFSERCVIRIHSKETIVRNDNHFHLGSHRHGIPGCRGTGRGNGLEAGHLGIKERGDFEHEGANQILLKQRREFSGVDDFIEASTEAKHAPDVVGGWPGEVIKFDRIEVTIDYLSREGITRGSSSNRPDRTITKATIAAVSAASLETRSPVAGFGGGGTASRIVSRGGHLGCKMVVGVFGI